MSTLRPLSPLRSPQQEQPRTSLCTRGLGRRSPIRPLAPCARWWRPHRPRLRRKQSSRLIHTRHRRRIAPSGNHPPGATRTHPPEPLAPARRQHETASIACAARFPMQTCLSGGLHRKGLRHMMRNTKFAMSLRSPARSTHSTHSLKNTVSHSLHVHLGVRRSALNFNSNAPRRLQWWAM